MLEDEEEDDPPPRARANMCLLLVFAPHPEHLPPPSLEHNPTSKIILDPKWNCSADHSSVTHAWCLLLEEGEVEAEEEEEEDEGCVLLEALGGGCGARASADEGGGERS